jgi:hypothetical protein
MDIIIDSTTNPNPSNNQPTPTTSSLTPPPTLISLLSSRFKLATSDLTSTSTGLQDQETMWTTLIWCMKKLIPGFALVEPIHGTSNNNNSKIIEHRVQEFLQQIIKTHQYSTAVTTTTATTSNNKFTTISQRSPLPLLWNALEFVLKYANTTNESNGELISKFELKISPTTGLVEEISGMREITIVRGPILGMSWHPTEKSLLAIFTKYNLHLIRDEKSFERAGAFPGDELGEIVAVSWRPYSSTVARACLAVAGRYAIALFDASNKNTESRWRVVNMNENGNRSLVGAISISWSYNGRYLYCASSVAPCVTVIDVAQIDLTRIVLIGKAPPPPPPSSSSLLNSLIVSCSPQLPRVFISGTSTKSFRLLDETTFTFDWWLFDDIITSACWNVNGELLLFATRTKGIMILDAIKGQCRSMISPLVLNQQLSISTATATATNTIDDVGDDNQQKMYLPLIITSMSLSRSSQRLAVVVGNIKVGLFMLNHNFNAKFIGCPISTLQGNSTACAFRTSTSTSSSNESLLAVAFCDNINKTELGQQHQHHEYIGTIRFLPCEV